LRRSGPSCRTIRRRVILRRRGCPLIFRRRRSINESIMLAVQRSPPAPTRLLPWSLPSDTWASPPRGIGFVPVESPPRTVQEYVMQAARPAPEPQLEATLVDAPRAPFLSPVVPSKRAAPKEPQPVPGAPSQEVDAAAVALRQLEAIARMPEPAQPAPQRTKALERQNSAHVVEKLRECGDVSREEITEAMREEKHTQASYGQLGGMMSGLLGPNTFRADYATTRVAGRSRCKKCRKYFHAGDVRVGKRPPRVQQDIKAVRVHWYHPACIFKSFERAAYKTKTLERVGDVEGFDDLRDADRADLAARIAAWSARRSAQFAHHKPKKGRGKKRKVTSLPDDLPSMVDDEAGFRAACGLLAAGLGADAPPSKKGGVLGFLARKKRRSDPVPLPSAERRSARARTPKVIVDAPDGRCPAKGGPGCCPARANNARPSAEALQLREELASLQKENAKLKAPSLCAEDASLLDALL